MNFALICSKQDLAGMNFYKLLLKEFNFKETKKEFDGNKVFARNFSANEFSLYLINEKQIFADYVNSIEADALVFMSKHASKAGKPSLTVHAPGNWGKAEMGGKDSNLAPVFGSLIKSYYLDLIERKKEFSLNEFEISLECTHHGPFLSKPSVFIELGSSEKQWGNESAARAIIETVLNASKIIPSKKAFIGLGGLHYCNEFNKILQRTDFCSTHICPEYALPNFNALMLSQAIEKSMESIELIALDWKGLGKEKERIISLLEELKKEKGISFERSGKII